MSERAFNQLVQLTDQCQRYLGLFQSTRYSAKVFAERVDWIRQNIDFYQYVDMNGEADGLSSRNPSSVLSIDVAGPIRSSSLIGVLEYYAERGTCISRLGFARGAHLVWAEWGGKSLESLLSPKRREGIAQRVGNCLWHESVWNPWMESALKAAK